MIRVGDRWLADFASCNYLGLDLDREVIESIPEYVQKWGTHPSWSRLLGSPALYEQIEERLTQLLGCEDTLILPTITLIHMSVIPRPRRRRGRSSWSRRAHKTIYEGCQFATARGATVKSSVSTTSTGSSTCFRLVARACRLICVDGVNSMTGNIDRPCRLRAPRPSIRRAPVCRRRTWLRRPRRARRRRALLRTAPREQHRASFRRELRPRLLVAGSLQGVLVARRLHRLPDGVEAHAEDGARRRICTRARRLSRRSPRCSTGFEVNDARRRDAIRARSVAQDRRCARLPRPAGRAHPESLRLPDHRGSARTPRATSTQVGRFLFDNGIYVTLAAYPLVPRARSASASR